MEKLQDHLAYPPRAFRADRAAAYLGVSTSKFHVLVAQGRLPKPVRIDGITLWDRFSLMPYRGYKTPRRPAQKSIEEHYGISGD